MTSGHIEEEVARLLAETVPALPVGFKSSSAMREITPELILEERVNGLEKALVYIARTLDDQRSA